MADKQLNDLYEGIDISEAEVAILREKLALQLSLRVNNETVAGYAKRSSWLSTAKNHLLHFWLKPAYIAGSLAAVFIVFLVTNQSSLLNSNSLQDIQSFVAANGNHQELFNRAEEMQASDDELARLNGLAVLSLLGSAASHKMASAQGLVEDPRPEFRAHYIEYLLDYADEDLYNIGYIEALMDKEEDEECLYLLGRLLKLALSRGQDDNDFI